jgi:LysM domain/WD40-like Beta Propeller Repeat
MLRCRSILTRFPSSRPGSRLWLRGSIAGAKAAAALQLVLIFTVALLMLVRLGWSEDWSLPAPLPSPTVVRTRLVTYLYRITPTPTVTSIPSITPTPTPFPENAILYTVLQGDTLLSISEQTGIDPAILVALNGLQDSHALVPGMQLMITIGQVPQPMVTPTGVTPAPTREALTAQSSPEEIIQRVNASHRNWRTLWLDAQIIDYGPPGYIGAPFVRREQLWLSSTRDGLLLIGKEGNSQPERIVLNINGTSYEHIIEEDQHPSYRTPNSILSNTQLTQLIDPIFSSLLQDRLEIVGEEQVAGRNAIVIDHFNIVELGDHFQGRYSIDARTEIGLRLLQYSDQERMSVSLEIRITDIRYDQDFPAELFDPYAGAITQFAQGPDGEPEDPAIPASRLQEVANAGRQPLPKRTPPPDFDPSRSQLAFQFTSLTRLGGGHDLAEVIAGSYYLGMLEFADPWNMNCSRSPNGRYIAFIPGLEEEPYRGSLRWFDLLDRAVVHDTLPELVPSWSNIAFSPDNHRLAFVACQHMESDCTIFLLDLSGGEPRPLLDVQGSSSLAWSPDGRQLAFLGNIASAPEWMLHIIDARSGEITYSGALDWEGYAPADPDAPVRSWGITFPIWNTGLEACTTPPE